MRERFAGARNRVLTIVATLALMAGLLVVLAPAGDAAPPTCAVSNARTHKDYGSVQAAADAAKAGDTLEVKGTCVGTTSVHKDVTLRGITNRAFPGRPTLDGAGTGTVLHITSGTATVDGLTITHGVASVVSTDGCCYGGGVAVMGSTAAAHIVDSLVTGNSAAKFGGGIAVREGTLTLADTSVSGNSASSSGGIDSDGGTLTLTHSSVSGNVATGGGTCTNAGLSCAGGIWNFAGTLTLIDSTVSGNSAANRGGGIVIQSSGAILTLSGTSTISSNTAGEFGGGIWFRSGTVTATADWTGSVSGNTPDQCSPSVLIGSTVCSA
jgi:predicted outer membrane repeat protein